MSLKTVLCVGEVNVWPWPVGASNSTSRSDTLFMISNDRGPGVGSSGMIAVIAAVNTIHT